MSRRGFADLPEEKRLLILSTAAFEFAAHGFEAASLNRIIEKCGMSKSSFYYYFDDKAELFSVLVDRASMRMVDAVAVPSHDRLSRDFWGEVEKLFGRILLVSEEQPWFLAFGKLFYQAPLQSGADIGRVYESIRDWVAEALTTAQESGAIRTDLPFDLLTESVFALLQALDRWSVRHLESFSHSEARDAAHMQTDFLKRMLAPIEAA
jgi:AcrR family transcriptional regulator